ncbi:MAG: ABC transporter permease [Persicimonas sp.]
MSRLVTLRISLRMLAARPLRTFLSVIGVMVGVAAVIVIVAVGKGAERQLVDKIRQMGTNLIVVNAGETPPQPGRSRQTSRVTTLTPDDAVALRRECPAVERTSSVVSKSVSVRYGAETVNTTLVGITSDGLAIRNVRVAKGRSFDPDQTDRKRRVALLGPTTAAKMFGELDPVGRDFRLGQSVFRVIGVSRARGTDVNGNDLDDVIYIPTRTALRRVLNQTHLDSVYVQARSSELLDQAEAEVRKVLRTRHRTEAGRDDFTIDNQATLIQAERQTSRSMNLLVVSVAGVSLLVGGVGILAVMLLSMRERAAEIGLRRAVGATRSDIRNQFLVEAGLLAGGGSLLGVAIGLAGAWSSPALGLWETVVWWPSVGISVLVALALGMLFGWYPAERAARMEPTEALLAD